MNSVAQQPVFGPGQIGDLGDELRFDPMDSGKNERRSQPPVTTSAPAGAPSIPSGVSHRNQQKIRPKTPSRN